MTLPLADGSFQAVKALTVNQVTSTMPYLQLKNSLEKIKAENPENKNFKN